MLKEVDQIIENEELEIDNIEERKKPKKKYQLPSSDRKIFYIS